MHFTPDHTRKVGVGMMMPSPSPFLTPRPERRRAEVRGVDGGGNRHDRDRETNVQVLLRCRPLSDDEQRLNIPKVISCNEQRREVTVLHNVANKQVDRAFTFDKVFGPKSQQRSIYEHAISPIVNEVLEGFNCTVFAYGQTGTGKTYTMEGGKTKGGELSAEAGVIPRAVRQIFDALEAQKADYSMKVTFLELYNEEITDLLAPEDSVRYGDDRQRKPISLMEDGRGGVIVRGLEEEVVYSANEIYNLLERGSSKRRSVDTLLNKHSSRSHSVFSINIHVKEATIGGEELIKCGKLNLVDLAGSENISRSGVRDSRAREAGEINKSLLTLGRVINALFEHSSHIPYRDSKLTRLLRESLGGKTKTCIIATISPSVHSLEETLSTLDYAYRAKNIKNKPEANQKISKTMLLKDLYLEMERMKQDVRAAREKNGVYIPHDRFAQDEADKKAMTEKIEQLSSDLELKEKQAQEFQELYLSEQEHKLDLESQLKECKEEMNLENCNKKLQELQENHQIAISTLKDKEFIISNLLNSENSILERAKKLRTNLQNASEDIGVLSGEIDRKNNMERENHQLVLTFGSQLDQSLKSLHRTVLCSVSQQQQQLRCMEEHICSFLASKCDASKVLESRIEKIKDTYNCGLRAMKELAETMQKGSSSNLEEIRSTIVAQTMAIENSMITAVNESGEVIHDIQHSLYEQKELLNFSAQQQEEGLRRSLITAQVISKATNEFFSDLHHRSSKLMTFVEENQVEKSRQIESLQRTFQEESSREKKVALEKIAIILGTLISNRTAMVSKVLNNMDEQEIETKGRLQQEMVDIQKLSVNANNDWNQYFKKVERNFLEDTVSAAETKAITENLLQECSNRVDDSRKQWEQAQLCVNRLNKDGLENIESLVEESICENDDVIKEVKSVSSSNSEEFCARTCDLLADVNNSLQLDHKAKEEMESMSTLCLGQLKSIQDNHGESVSDIRKLTDQCLSKEYSVDHTKTPTKRVLEVPTVESIEELRTPSSEDLVAKLRSLNGTKGGNTGGKMKHQQQPSMVSPNRSPFAAVN